MNHCLRGLCEQDGAPCFCGCADCKAATGKIPAQQALDLFGAPAPGPAADEGTP